VSVIIFFFRLFPFNTAESSICQSISPKETASISTQNNIPETSSKSKGMGDAFSNIDANIRASKKTVSSGSPSKNQAETKLSQFNFPPFKGKKGEKVFHPIIHEFSKKHDLDPALIKAIVMAESGYNPEAVSKKGARGLMQLMPKTAESLGVKDCFNPKQNISGGVRYFKKLFNKFNGDISLALAAYNAGITHVRKHNGVPPFKATRFYVQKVFHYYQYYKNQSKESVLKADV
jgi:soluble lytic murein transglycosylase-like protein